MSYRLLFPLMGAVVFAFVGCGGGSSSSSSSDSSAGTPAAPNPCPTESSVTLNGTVACTPSPLIVSAAHDDASGTHKYTVDIGIVGFPTDVVLQWADSAPTGHKVCGVGVICNYTAPDGTSCTGMTTGSFDVSGVGSSGAGRIAGSFTFTLNGAGACTGNVSGTYSLLRGIDL